MIYLFGLDRQVKASGKDFAKTMKIMGKLCVCSGERAQDILTGDLIDWVDLRIRSILCYTAMDIDYSTVLPKVLTNMFPDANLRSEVVAKMDRYGTESFHREIDRVRLGILKLVFQEPDKLEYYVSLACDDYRDLLCCAEYPLTSRRLGLKDKDPEKYKELSDKESHEYKSWLDDLLAV